jgi:hypothetical protein
MHIVVLDGAKFEFWYAQEECGLPGSFLVKSRSWSAWAECAGRSGGATGLSGVPARGDQDDRSASNFLGGGKVQGKLGRVARP